jgi:hypothetical protein
VCIFGTGRSGTTLLFRLLCDHPSVGWFSNYTNRFPGFPPLAFVARAMDYDWLRSVLREGWPVTPRPCEAYRLYNVLTDGAFELRRPLDASDATPEVIRRYRSRVAAHLAWQGKERFVQKHTGFPHTGFLSAIFPDARFINVIRDGRAVVSSMLKVPWWDGTMKSWWWGPMRPEYEEEYERSGREPVVLAAIVWKTLMHSMEEVRASLPEDRYMELRYDSLVRDAHAVVARVASFCDLPPSTIFDRRVAAVHVRDEDTKWRRELTGRQRTLLEASLAGALERYGFAP